MILRTKSNPTYFPHFVAVLVFVLVAFVAFKGFQRFRTNAGPGAAEQKADEQIRQVALGLKNRLAATRNFPRLAFLAPSGPSIGAGFLVDPNKDFSGKTSVGNDLIFAVVSVTAPTAFRLAKAFLQGETSFDLSAEDPKVKLSEVLHPNDLLVFSSTQSSEVVRIDGPIPEANTGTIHLHPEHGFENTYLPSGKPAGRLNQNYVGRDIVTPATLMRIGVDPTSNELRFGKSTEDFIKLGLGVSQFSASYNLKDNPDLCEEVKSPRAADVNELTFARDKWEILNTASGHKCYLRLRAVQLAFVVDGKNAAYTFYPKN